jgi:hypothetical protein
MKTKNEYIECLTLKLKEWDYQIDYLTTEINANRGDIQQQHIENLQLLHIKRQRATEKMAELQDARGDSWVPVARTANEVWDNLRIGIAHFKLIQSQDDFVQW